MLVKDKSEAKRTLIQLTGEQATKYCPEILTLCRADCMCYTEGRKIERVPPVGHDEEGRKKFFEQGRYLVYGPSCGHPFVGDGVVVIEQSA